MCGVLVRTRKGTVGEQTEQMRLKWDPLGSHHEVLGKSSHLVSGQQPWLASLHLVGCPISKWLN